MASFVMMLFITLLSFSALFSTPAAAQDSDITLSSLLWDSVNEMTTPLYLEGAMRTPAVVFQMLQPGFTLDGNAFDPVFWEQSGYAGTSPGLNAFRLVNKVPAFSQSFIDTGRQISDMWEEFLTLFIVKVPQISEAQRLQLEEAITELYPNGFNATTESPLMETRDSWLALYQQQFLDAIQFRDECLQDKSLEGISGTACSQLANLNQERLSALQANYLTIDRQIKSLQANIIALQQHNLVNVIMENMLDFQSSQRVDLGSETMFQPYLEVSFEPADWYTWFQEGGESNNDAAWTSVTLSLDELSTYTESSSQQRVFGSSLNYQRVFYSAGGSFTHSSESESSSFAEMGTDIEISFEITRVNIIRPWLRASLLDFHPIAMEGLSQGAWSSGEMDGEGSFPLLPTAMIIARNIRITASQWSQEASNEFSTQSTSSSSRVRFGPFSASGSYESSSSNGQSSSSFSFADNTLSIQGPQVIGYLSAGLPTFPSANPEDVTPNGEFEIEVPVLPAQGPRQTVNA